eukprot:12037908-Ditylum_brightwellii.AAC.2
MYYQRKQPDVEISVGVNTKAREREALEHASGDESQDKYKDVKEDDGTEEDEALLHLITCEEDDESDDESDDETNDLPETVALEEAKEANDGGSFKTFTTTRVGRVFRPNTKYGIETMAFTQAEMGYHANLCETAIMEYAKEDFQLDFEVAGVGAGIGGGFTHTQEQKAMKYNEAMKADHEG